MNIFDPDQKELDAILQQAYRAREDSQAGGQWRERVMARIREADAPGRAERFLPVFGDLVWQLAPVSCLLAVVLIAILLTLAPAQADPLQSFVTGTEEAALTQVFGV
jgi:hypothetical protein